MTSVSLESAEGRVKGVGPHSCRNDTVSLARCEGRPGGYALPVMKILRSPVRVLALVESAPVLLKLRHFIVSQLDSRTV